MKHFFTEFLIVVAGILVALAVDQWRSDREELEIAKEHLVDVTAEVRGNLCTVERIRVRALDEKRAGLQAVLTFLNDPSKTVADPSILLNDFARAAISARPWLLDNAYQSLQNSGNVRLVHKLQPDLNLATAYESPDVLLSQVDRMQGAYPVVVTELIPAQLQARVNPLERYSHDAKAPDIAETADLNAAIDDIRARRAELLALARNEAAVTTADWFALTRIRAELEGLLKSLAPWDASQQPLPEFLQECAAPRR